MRSSKLISSFLISLAASSIAMSMPVEDVTTEGGVWATLGKMGIEIEPQPQWWHSRRLLFKAHMHKLKTSILKALTIWLMQ